MYIIMLLLVLHILLHQGLHMINAIDLRKRGLKAIDEALAIKEEGVISYNGKPKYVVIPFEKYDKLKSLELDMAYLEVIKNIKKGNYKTLKSAEDIDKHIEQLKV